jgi:hypothetical protein
MRVEVDQSGKVEDTRVDTVLAFSDGTSGSILIPAKVKRKCVEFVRDDKHKTKTLYLRIFCAGLFLLLKNHLPNLDQIVIDVEYLGREHDIKALLLRLIWEMDPKFDPDKIQFSLVGKDSPAHIKGYSIFTESGDTDQKVSFEDLKDFL